MKPWQTLFSNIEQRAILSIFSKIIHYFLTYYYKMELILWTI